MIFVWLYFFPFLFRGWIICSVCMFVWGDWFMYLPMIKLYFTFISLIHYRLWRISHSWSVLFIKYAHCMVTFQILTPCTKLLYLSSMVLWRTSLYFFYLGDDEWMGSRMPSIEASNWEQISAWHDEHWCFQTLCLMNFVSMSYCSNLIVCIVVNLIQETISSHFMGMCMFRVNSAELCK